MMLHEEMIGDEQQKMSNVFNIEGEMNESLSGDEPNGGGSTTDRSSASPSNADEMNDLLEDEVDEVDEIEEKEEQNENIEQRISGIDTKFVYVQHQLSRIMRHLHITPCACENCSSVHESINGVRQLNDPTQMLSQLFPNASMAQLRTLLDLSKMNKLPSQVVTQKDSQPQNQNQNQNQNQILKDQTSKIIAGLGTGYSSNQGGGKMPSTPSNDNRKSLSEFTKNHTTNNSVNVVAAKKFGFAPPVSNYYQKKESSNSLISTPLTSVPNVSISNSTNGTTSHPTVNSATASPGPSSDGGDRDELMIESTNNQQSNEPTSVVTSSASTAQTPVSAASSAPAMAAAAVAAAASPMFAQSMVDILKMNANAAHSTGSPGFLRGRGRGRPKLIGDELDADLVDYMVQVKQTDPHGHMTASQALLIAKQYILERAPGLLEEHGGHVKLKLTWAMKLVTRIAERQKEIEYGLPAGSLSNMGRNLNTLPGGNFMADVMAQNILSQHMMMVNQITNSGDNQQNQSTHQKSNLKIENHQNEENVRTSIASIPEIVNIKEINLPFLNNFLAELNEKNNAAIDGEIDN